MAYVYRSTEDEMNDALVGRVVVLAGEDGDAATLVLDNGTVANFALDADCCSSSFFTDKRQFAELVGSKIAKVEERDSDHGSVPNDPTADTTSWHFLVFVTNKGHVTIDWRNESNGYYDGRVMFTISPEAK